MAKPPNPSRKPPELKHAAAWQAFYHGPGRPALAALFTEFGLYGVAPPDIRGEDALRREGQRDVLLRLVQLLGLKEGAAPADAWEDVDILDRMIGSHDARR